MPEREPGRETIMSVDPVCFMTVEEAAAAAKSTYLGDTYYFCCAACKDQFDANPASYVGAD